MSKRSAIAFVVGIVALPGCPAKPATKNTTTRLFDTATTREGVIEDISSYTLELYSHLSLGNLSGYTDSFSQDRLILVWGPGPKDVISGHSPQKAADIRPFPSYVPEWLPKNLGVVLGPKFNLAWTYDEVSCRFIHNDLRYSFPLRQTRLLLREQERWTIVLEHSSVPVAREDLLRMAEHKELQTSDLFTPFESTPTLASFVSILQALLTGQAWPMPPADLSFLLLLPDRTEFLEPQAVISLADWFGPGSQITIPEASVDFSKDGSVAWLGARIIVAVPSAGAEEPLQIELRNSAIFTKQKEQWVVRLVHISVPITPAQLERQVFGN